jgi:hypothetical protein
MLVVAAAVVGCQAAAPPTPQIVFVTPPPEEAPSPISPAPGTPTAAPTATQRATPTAAPRTPRPTRAPTPSPVPRAELEVVDSGFTVVDGNASYGVVIRNPNAAGWVAEFVSVQITFFDATGPTKTESDTLRAVLPGQETAVGGTAFDVDRAERMEVRLGSVSWETIDFPPGRFVVENVRTRDRDFGGHRTTGIISSEFVERQDLIRVVAIYRNADGEIIGGDFSFLDFLDPDAEASFEITTFNTLRGLDSTDVYWQV